NDYGKGWAEGENIYVENDSIYRLMVYSDTYYQGEGIIDDSDYSNENGGLMCRIDIRKYNYNSTYEENNNYYKNLEESLDGFHLLPNMTLIDSLTANNRVNFTAIEGDSLYFIFRLLDSTKEINTKDIDFDIIDSSGTSVFYDSINASSSNWDIKRRNKEIILSGLIKETNDYDLLVKSNYKGIYKLRLYARRLGLDYDGLSIASDSWGKEIKQSYQNAIDFWDGAELKINQSYQGFFNTNQPFAPMDLNRRYFWFEVKEGDDIMVKISPLPWDYRTDISYDIRDSAHISIHNPRVWRLLDYSYIAYFILFSPILFLLFRGLFIKPRKEL
ncbi:MAG: hypothetical protein P8X62_12465, partial [Flavobacteriaceae bacterium]